MKDLSESLSTQYVVVAEGGARDEELWRPLWSLHDGCRWGGPRKDWSGAKGRQARRELEEGPTWL